MSLRKELQDRWTTTHDNFTRWQAKVDELVNELRDLETAIAALTPAPDFSAEKATAREQLEREPEIPEGFIRHDGSESPVMFGESVWTLTRGCGEWPVKNIEEIASHWTWAGRAPHDTDILAYAPYSGPVAQAHPDEQDDASEFAESELEAGGVVAQHECTCHPDDAPPVCQHLYAASQCQASYRNGASLGTLGSIDERPALNADMQDEREQPAPATNPEADEAAKAHEYYDPKAVADRERNAGLARLFAYNPFYKPKVDA